jgi:hypothetical protein
MHCHGSPIKAHNHETETDYKTELRSDPDSETARPSGAAGLT